MPPITEICVNCTGDNCTYECRPVSANFRISNIVLGENYTITLSLRNGFGQSGESVPQLYGEGKAVSVMEMCSAHLSEIKALLIFFVFTMQDLLG